MTQPKIMQWIDALPNVEETDFQTRRDEIIAMMNEAAELTRRAEELRGKAYLQSLRLEGDAKSRWTAQEIDSAAARVAWK
jgi:hypothetical protein